MVCCLGYALECFGVALVVLVVVLRWCFGGALVVLWLYNPRPWAVVSRPRAVVGQA